MTIRDLPDNYPWMPGSSRYPMPDMGELAARLGSPVIYDRRGEVVWLDIFNNGLANWLVVESGTGASVKITATDTDLGPYAAKLTGGSDGAREAALIRRFPITSLHKVGFEVSVYYTSTSFDYIQMDLIRYDGTNQHEATIRISTPATQEYRDSAAALIGFATKDVLASTKPIYHNLKLVVDMDNDEYVRFLYDDVEYDLSGIAIRVQASAAQAQHYAQFSVHSDSGQNDIVQVGRVIITGNEP